MSTIDLDRPAPSDQAIDLTVSTTAVPSSTPTTPARRLRLVTSDRDEVRSAGASLPRLVLGLFVFAAPFLLISSMARNMGLLSNDHSRLLMEAMALRQFPGISSLDFSEPPLLTMLVAIWPQPVLVQYLSALFGGAVAYVLWSQLRQTRLPWWLNAGLVLSFCAAPAVLLTAGMHASDMLALLLLLLAWRSYTQFVHHGVTWHGFVAGLLLGLAFFASFLTILFVIPFALGAPSFMQNHLTAGGRKVEPTKRDRNRAVVAGLVVIAFPGICALGSWMYLAWIGTGQTFYVFSQLGAAVTATHDIPSFMELARLTAGDLVRQPLYVAVGGLMAMRGPRQLIALLFPLALVTVPRAFGWQYDEGFVAACYLGFAVLGLAVMSSERPGLAAPLIRNRLITLVSVAVAAQVAVSVALPLRSAEVENWRTAVFTGAEAPTRLADAETALASRLAEQPQGVILADELSSPLIARAGTTLPFLLPMSDQFQPAVWNPSHVVDHVLLPASPSPDSDSRIVRMFRFGALEGFHLDTDAGGWLLYTRDGMPDLVR
jgi:hypothetical protein